MKTLYIVRHAEASGQNANIKDFDRPLNSRGNEDLSRMGERLCGWAGPDLVISSPALRAKTTAQRLAEIIGHPVSNIVFDERIYEADVEDLTCLIREVDDSVTNMMLVGHNPGLTHLANSFGECDIRNMPTCSIVVLKFPVDSWGDLGRVQAELSAFDYPGKEERSYFE